MSAERAAALPPGKFGRNWIAVRDCGRCGGRFSHPLERGWRVGATEAGEQVHVCPGCAEPDDPMADGSTPPLSVAQVAARAAAKGMRVTSGGEPASSAHEGRAW